MPRPRKPKLSSQLREARIRQGLTAPQLAKRIGVSQSSIYFWETEHCQPRPEHLKAVCKALKLPLRATQELAGR
jgi:transcriptional regulator with XRE-family HTH domain